MGFTADKYKVKAGCLSCGRKWTTKAKPDKKAPRRCHGQEGCGSTQTSKHKVWKKVDGDLILVEDHTGRTKQNGDRYWS